VKSVLQINGNNKDGALADLIDLVEDFIKGYCNDDYINGFPPGYELIAIKMIEFNMNKAGVTQESLSRWSATFETDYPKSITKGLKRKVSW
jgi:hypothetical protein